MAKRNVPPTTEIDLTLTLEEWFSILAVLAKSPHVSVLSEYGAQCYKRGSDKITAQLTEWSRA